MLLQLCEASGTKGVKKGKSYGEPGAGNFLRTAC